MNINNLNFNQKLIKLLLVHLLFSSILTYSVEFNGKTGKEIRLENWLQLFDKSKNSSQSHLKKLIEIDPVSFGEITALTQLKNGNFVSHNNKTHILEEITIGGCLKKINTFRPSICAIQELPSGNLILITRGDPFELLTPAGEFRKLGLDSEFVDLDELNFLFSFCYFQDHFAFGFKEYIKLFIKEKPIRKIDTDFCVTALTFLENEHIISGHINGSIRKYKLTGELVKSIIFKDEIVTGLIQTNFFIIATFNAVKNGVIRILNHENKLLEEIKTDSPIRSLSNLRGGIFATGHKNGKIIIWQSSLLCDDPPNYFFKENIKYNKSLF